MPFKAGASLEIPDNRSWPSILSSARWRQGGGPLPVATLDLYMPQRLNLGSRPPYPLRAVSRSFPMNDVPIHGRDDALGTDPEANWPNSPKQQECADREEPSAPAPTRRTCLIELRSREKPYM